MKRALAAAIFLSALLALPALFTKIRYDRPTPVALMVDAGRLKTWAAEEGITFEEALRWLRGLGVNASAHYDERVLDKAASGEGVYLEGGLLALIAPKAGFQPGWYYTTVKAAANIPLPQHRVFWRGETWIGFATDVAKVPVGPGRDVNQAHRLGSFVAFRPENHLLHPWPPSVPPEARVHVFVGTEVLGWPDHLEEAASYLKRPVAVIEGVRQAGIEYLAKKLGAVRLFSLQAEYQMKLSPEAAAAKYALAARERSHQILYFRPYPTREKTERFVAVLKKRLAAAGIPVGEPEVKRYERHPLAAAGDVGALAGLLLYLSHLPFRLALPTGVFLLALAFGVGREGAWPLLVGLVFPVLGFLGGFRGLATWIKAVLYALIGGVFITVLGANQETLWGLSAFRGVGLLLVVPPALFLLAQLPRENWREALVRLYEHRIKLGEAALAFLLLSGLALAFLRRGNDAPFVFDFELLLRSKLEALMIRPRFKEIFGHGAVVFAALAGGEIPLWLRTALVAFGVVAEASILDSFAHYHTPFLVSLVRSLNGALFGVILGLAIWALYRGGKRWLWR